MSMYTIQPTYTWPAGTYVPKWCDSCNCHVIMQLMTYRSRIKMAYQDSMIHNGQYHINMKLIIRQYGVHTSIVVNNYSQLTEKWCANQNHMPWYWKFTQNSFFVSHTSNFPRLIWFHIDVRYAPWKRASRSFCYVVGHGTHSFTLILHVASWS